MFHRMLTKGLYLDGHALSFVRKLHTSSSSVATKPLFPYGWSSWSKMRHRSSFFADQTATIKLLSFHDYAYLRRPRRMGKSLLVNQLVNYYDIADKDKFNELFEGTAIFEDPGRPKSNTSLVLKLSFSNVDPVRDLNKNFSNYLIMEIRAFSEKYYDDLKILKRPVVVTEGDCLASFGALICEVDLSGHELSLFVDEFDSFANRLLLEVDSTAEDSGKSQYNKTVKAAESLVRGWGNAVKNGTDTCLTRFFFTGVAPFAFNDGLSSLNNAEDLTLNPRFASSLGFTSEHVDQGLALFNLSEEETKHHKTVMAEEFDGSRYAEGQEEGMYNPQLVLYYLKYMSIEGKAPNPLVDENVISPLDNVAQFLLRHHKASEIFGESALVQFMFGDFPTVVSTKLRGESLFSTTKSEEALVTLAYHHGFLTYPPPHNQLPLARLIRSGITGKVGMIAPNKTYRQLFLQVANDLDDPKKAKEALKGADTFVAEAHAGKKCVTEGALKELGKQLTKMLLQP